ncbi:MAG TPA: adenylyl-sulfate kinase [Egibacteraceae bacterium]|nr:adenylyl-sulfate kinase [Egibacteraceae bacterium]
MGEGYVLWFTGLSGAGKSTIAGMVERELRARQAPVEVLDGDVVRTHLSKGLTFSREDRDTNVLRIGWVAGMLSRHGVGVITAAISPYAETRREAREMAHNFVEIFVDAPLEECIRRDVKGLYAQAMAEEIPNFTGVSDPYEPPVNPELHLRTAHESPEESAAKVIGYVERQGWLKAAAGQ